MKALIGMSGGVDSSVAAYLTQQAGLDCAGATMLLYTGQDREGSCSSDGVHDAKAVADRLNMPFHVLNLSREFEKQVMEDFVLCYEAGATPNPCIQCNRHLKFGRFLDCARELGYDCIVTGHYARILHNSDTGRWELRKAADEAKDQSYFLYTLTQEQLSATRFPLGELTKAQAREIAENQGFINAKKRDSQDICFVPDGDYAAFLCRYTGKNYPQGDYLDLQGNVVGKHKGAVAYTLGQRKGLNLAMGEPVYVCGKDMEKNTVTVGPNEALMSTSLLANSCNWIAIPQPEEPVKVLAKARSRMTEQPATVYPLEDGTVRVVFDKPQRAITPGQAVVFYQGDRVLGGGTITKSL